MTRLIIGFDMAGDDDSLEVAVVRTPDGHLHWVGPVWNTDPEPRGVRVGDPPVIQPPVKQSVFGPISGPSGLPGPGNCACGVPGQHLHRVTPPDPSGQWMLRTLKAINETAVEYYETHGKAAEARRVEHENRFRRALGLPPAITGRPFGTPPPPVPLDAGQFTFPDHAAGPVAPAVFDLDTKPQE